MTYNLKRREQIAINFALQHAIITCVGSRYIRNAMAVLLPASFIKEKKLTYKLVFRFQLYIEMFQHIISYHLLLLIMFVQRYYFLTTSVIAISLAPKSSQLAVLPVIAPIDLFNPRVRAASLDLYLFSHMQTEHFSLITAPTVCSTQS